jgi:hypothetical protein
MFDVPATASTNTNVSWLVPTMTAFGGYVSGFLVEWFRDARAHSREREAKATARSEAQTDRRLDFQRQSLLDLQDAICEMVADVRQVHVEGAAQMLGGREWSKVAASVETSTKAMNSRDRVIKLRARIRDDQTHKLTGNVLVAIVRILDATSYEVAKKTLAEVEDSLRIACERIGATLKTFDEAEE